MIAKMRTNSLRMVITLIVALFLVSCDIFTGPDKDKVATPTFDPPGAAYISGQTVAISCSTPGATIYYSTDGSAPTLSYVAPITIAVTCTLKAVATRLEWKDSTVASSSYNIGRISTPTFNPSGGIYHSVQEVTISCATSGATIRYTIDNSEPNESSPIYDNPITVNNTSTITTLKARAYKSGWSDSNIASANYTINVATPTFNPQGGTYSSTQNVSISCSTYGAMIRYTTNGSDPTSSSTVYSSPIYVSSSTTTLKAKAYKSGWTDSSVATSIYTLSPETPTFNLPGGTYTSAQEVSLSCTTSGVTIHFTTNGSSPSSSSPVYSSPIYVASTTTIKAIGFKDGWTPSAITSATYTILVTPGQMIAATGGTFHNGTSYVTLNSFYIGNCEVTQNEYQTVMGSNPSLFSGNPDRPVEQVSWFKAIEYCNRRSMQEYLTPCYSYSTYGTNPSNWPSGWATNSANHSNVVCNWSANGYRLPTEMEWMFAAIGGNQSQGYLYSGSNTIGYVGWYLSNSSNRTHDVVEKSASELGTFDMSGNVWEWCWDIFGDYPNGNQMNPHGSVSGSVRVGRGGGYNYSANACTVSYRSSSNASNAVSSIGFRVVRIFQ